MEAKFTIMRYTYETYKEGEEREKEGYITWTQYVIVLIFDHLFDLIFPVSVCLSYHIC